MRYGSRLLTCPVARHEDPLPHQVDVPVERLNGKWADSSAYNSSEEVAVCKASATNPKHLLSPDGAVGGATQQQGRSPLTVCCLFVSP
jgi:hypothetical protein